ncbi:MAG TPA: HDOD domain-containing protein, partial [Terriglobales bacterium]
NMLAFPQEFANAMRVALQQEIPLGEAEEAVMGFTHCLTGRILAEKWKLTDDLVQVIAHHHAVGEDSTEDPMIALVHLGDQLCRMRNLGYGYYERHKIDMVYDPAWSTLSKYHNLSQVDLARFTFEFDEDLKEIELVVASVFGAGSARN